MKKLLLCITAIAGISVHAQTSLHNTDWYLKKSSEITSPIIFHKTAK